MLITKKKYNELTDHIESLKASVETLELSIACQRSKNVKLAERVKDLEHDLDAQRATNDKLTRQINIVKTNISTVSDKLNCRAVQNIAKIFVEDDDGQ